MQVLNYRIVVEKEDLEKGVVYVAYAPSLGVSDFGATVEEAVEHITEAITLYLETLIEMKKPLPEQDSDDYFVTTSRVEISGYEQASFV